MAHDGPLPNILLNEGVLNMISSVLECIDELDNVQIETTVSVCESMLNAYQKAEIILEEYEGDDISAFTVFQEGYIMEADKMDVANKKESTIMTIIKKIRDAIAKLFAKIFKKLGCNGFDPDKVGIESTPQKVNAEIKKVDKASKKHPLLTGVALTLGGTAAIYGGSKAIDKIEKSIAWKELDQYEKDTINAMFEQSNNSFNFRYDVDKIIKVLYHLDAYVPSVLTKFHNALYGSKDSDNKIKIETAIEFAEKNGLLQVQKSLKDICDWLDEHEALSFETEKTHCATAEKYNVKVAELNDVYVKTTEKTTKTIAVIDKLAYDVLLKLPQDSKAKTAVEKQYNQIAKYVQKITTIMNDVTIIKDKIDADTRLLNQFLNKFYKVDRTAKDIKRGIRSAANAAAEIYNIATDKR